MHIKKILKFGIPMGIMFLGNLAFSKNTPLSEKDQEVLRNLNKANIEEIQIGELIQKKASNPAVKDFAKRMVNDHTKLKNQVQELASKEGISLPSPASKEENAMHSDLSRRSGKDLDEHYIQEMLKDHQKDIMELQNYAYTTTHPEMKNFVKATLPVLENHLRVAEHVAGQIGVPADKGLNQPERPS